MSDANDFALPRFEANLTLPTRVNGMEQGIFDRLLSGGKDFESVP